MGIAKLFGSIQTVSVLQTVSHRDSIQINKRVHKVIRETSSPRGISEGQFDGDDMLVYQYRLLEYVVID